MHLKISPKAPSWKYALLYDKNNGNEFVWDIAHRGLFCYERLGPTTPLSWPPKKHKIGRFLLSNPVPRACTIKFIDFPTSLSNQLTIFITGQQSIICFLNKRRECILDLPQKCLISQHLRIQAIRIFPVLIFKV